VVAEVNLVVQVWAGGFSGGADDADDGAGGDVLSYGDRWAHEHVAVAGHDFFSGATGVGVFDVDVPAAAGCGGRAVSVAAVWRCVVGVALHDSDGPGGGGEDGCAAGGAQVHAVVAGSLGGPEAGADRCVYWLGPALRADVGAAVGEGCGDAGQLACRIQQIMSKAERGAAPVPRDSSTLEGRIVGQS